VHEALALQQQALDPCLAAGNETGQAELLNDMGWVLAMLGDFPQALASCEKGLAMLEDLSTGSSGSAERGFHHGQTGRQLCPGRR
jgi:Tetratricopeptide repeat